MLDSFWWDLPPLLRAGAGLLLVVLSIVLWFFTGRLWTLISIGGFGLVLILTSRLNPDRNEYRF